MYDLESKDLQDTEELPPRPQNGEAGEEAGEQEDEDGEQGDTAPDWSKLMPRPARTAIPKRGEKEFEPRAGGGSGLQQHVLQSSRDAMFSTLRGVRATSSKSLSHGIWYPTLARVHVTTARGTHMSSMGHSVSRPPGAPKRLELLPEEAIYLIERGSLFCWKHPETDAQGDEDRQQQFTLEETEDSVKTEGVPMCVQQAYSEMLNRDGVTSERLQVYTYLRRLGYVVTRTIPPTPSYPAAQPHQLTLPQQHSPSSSILNHITSWFGSLWTRICRLAFSSEWDAWKPLSLQTWSVKNRSYKRIYESLRFIPSGHKTPLLPRATTQTPPVTQPVSKAPLEQEQEQERKSHYTFFYNVYKPNTSFKRTAPPKPDYQIVVINARTTPMPTLRELTALFDQSPELPPPLPRQRVAAVGGDAPGGKGAGAGAVKPSPSPLAPGSSPAPAPASASEPSSSTPTNPTNPTQTRQKPTSTILSTSLFRPILNLFHSSSQKPPPYNQQSQLQRKPHPFMALKAGDKTVIIAAVDSGSISFYRFGRGVFEAWPMYF